MGFLDAVLQMGELDNVSGVERYVKFPLDVNKEARMIQIYLDIEDLAAHMLHVRGVLRVSLVDFLRASDMKMKYLWRDRVGSNTFWGFTPIYKMGKPPASEDKRREAFFKDPVIGGKIRECHLKKIKARVLDDYEKEGIFTEGSVARIMEDLPGLMENLMSQLTDNKLSHIVVFGGVGENDRLVYPGEIRAMVEYFEKKLAESLGSKEQDEDGCASNLRRCAVCGREGETSNLDKVFKFATADKVSILPGLDESEAPNVFPVCTDCLGKLATGRSRIEKDFTNTSAIPGMRIWVTPEGVGGIHSDYRLLVGNLESSMSDGKLGTLGATVEERYFERLAKHGEGLIFHFVFWEQNNSQELVHLMVEDVPPERLARLEEGWRQAFFSVFDQSTFTSEVNLDLAVRSLYRMLSDLAGKSNSDKKVSRDFAVQVLEHLLSGRRPPKETFKQFVVSRLPAFDSR